MATKPADRVVVDTNVLLAATDRSRDEHSAAMAVLNDWPRAGTVLYASAQIMREYLVVATRPIAQNGLGLAAPDAVANVRALRARVELLQEDRRVNEHLFELVEQAPCAGKQIHDANVVATMLVHGVDTLVTLNLADFTRFGNRIRVIGLPDDIEPHR